MRSQDLEDGEIIPPHDQVKADDTREEEEPQSDKAFRCLS